ncbi:hypothetical protein ABPG77_004651 [Micractinium sp. CCAP 211/92]
MQAALTSSAVRPAGLAQAVRPSAQRPRVARAVVCSAAPKKEAVAAGVTAAAVAVLANPLAAEAAVTPSLNNLLGSLVAGGVVLAAIAGAITAVSNFDSIRR